MIAPDGAQGGPVDADRRGSLFEVGARGAQLLLVAGASELPQPVEHGPALAVQLLHGQQGELPVLRIDPAVDGKG